MELGLTYELSKAFMRRSWWMSWKWQEVEFMESCVHEIPGRPEIWLPPVSSIGTKRHRNPYRQVPHRRSVKDKLAYCSLAIPRRGIWIQRNGSCDVCMLLPLAKLLWIWNLSGRILEFDSLVTTLFQTGLRHGLKHKHMAYFNELPKIEQKKHLRNA